MNVSDSSSKVNKDIAKLLNRDNVKSNLVLASLYTTIFEVLKDAIVNRIKSFYSRGEFDENGNPIPSEPDYTNQVKSLYNKNILRASLLWLKSNNAISEKDEQDFLLIRDHRNDIVHELAKYLIDSDFEVNTYFIIMMMELLRKIEVWWIVNVEIPINSDFDGEEIDEKDIAPGTVAILQYVVSVVLTNESPKT